MIRRRYVKSRRSYPEVFHRFCGYLIAVNVFVRLRAQAQNGRSQAPNPRHPRPRVFRAPAFELCASRGLLNVSRGPTCDTDLRPEDSCYNRAPAGSAGQGWACSTAVSAGDSSKRCLRGESREVDGMNSGNPSGLRTDGNPEPSRRYIAGRCRDYLRTSVSLMTG